MPDPEDRIDFARLVGWMEGRLSAEEARIVEEQITAADDATRAEAAWLRRFADAARVSAPLESPPPEVRRTLVSRFEAHAEGRRASGFFRRVAATLSFDSGSRPAVGVRAGTQERRRQLIFSVEAFDVALNLRPSAQDAKYLDVDGQVFPREETELAGIGVQLLRDGAELTTTVTGDLGGFVFERVPPGDYELILSTERFETLLSPLELHA